jgi:hypothetical protein
MTFREYVDRDDLSAEEELQALKATFHRFMNIRKAGFKDKYLEKELYEMQMRMKTLQMRLYMMNRKEKDAA